MPFDPSAPATHGDLAALRSEMALNGATLRATMQKLLELEAAHTGQPVEQLYAAFRDQVKQNFDQWLLILQEIDPGLAAHMDFRDPFAQDNWF